MSPRYAWLAVLAAGCATEVMGGTTPHEIDAGVAADANELPQIDAGVCGNQALDESFGDVGDQPVELIEYPNVLLIRMPVPDSPANDWLQFDLYKAYEPFGATVNGTATFLFSGGTQTTCAADSKVCGSLRGDDPNTPTAQYRLGLGTLKINIADAPVTPPASICSQHDGPDPTDCDAETAVDCAWFFCSQKCYPNTTSLCDGGCWYGCGVSGQLDGAMFFDEADQACQTELQHINWDAPSG